MFTWLIAIPFVGTLVNVLSPLVRGLIEGVVEWLSACWHGVKTSNYGSWTLLLTACALTWMLTSCPPCKSYSPYKSTSVIGKTSEAPDANSVFLDWFRLH